MNVRKMIANLGCRKPKSSPWANSLSVDLRCKENHTEGVSCRLRKTERNSADDASLGVRHHTTSVRMNLNDRQVSERGIRLLMKTIMEREGRQLL